MSYLCFADIHSGNPGLEFQLDVRVCDLWNVSEHWRKFLNAEGTHTLTWVDNTEVPPLLTPMCPLVARLEKKARDHMNNMNNMEDEVAGNDWSSVSGYSSP